MTHNIISIVDRFKLEKFSAHMAHWNEWPFPVMQPLTFLPSTMFQLPTGLSQYKLYFILGKTELLEFFQFA